MKNPTPNVMSPEAPSPIRHSHRSAILIAFFAGTALLLSGWSLQAQITWDYSWTGSAAPNASGELFYQVSNATSYSGAYSANAPPPHKEGDPVTVNLTTTLNPGNTFTIDSGGVKQTSRSYRNTAEWTGWDPGNYTAIEMRLRVDEEYPQDNSSIYQHQALPVNARYAQHFILNGNFTNHDGNGRYDFFLRDNNVGFGDASQVGGNQDNYALDMSTFQTLRIFLYDNKAELYHYNTTTTNFDLVLTSTTSVSAGTGFSGARLEFGDTAGRGGTDNYGYGNSKVTYDYIQWTNNIPEPTTAGLTLTGFLLLFSRRRRKIC